MSSDNVAILGFASNLDATHFTPFLQSLRRVGYDGRVAVFVSNLDPSAQAEIAQWADQVIPVDAEYPAVAPAWALAVLRRIKTTRGLRRHFGRAYAIVGRALHAEPGTAMARDLEFQLQGIQALRYRHYLRYLDEHPEIEQVIISDLRDVMFQADPFATELTDLEVCLEERHVLTSEAGFNSRWIRDLYGQDGLDELGDAVVSCSGVTIGPRRAMMAYLEAMADEVDRHVVQLGPHDQAIHNWLLYQGRLAGARPVPNGTGRVQTMGEQREIYLSTDGAVLNPDGRPPAVLHQYDRHVGLAERLWADLASWREQSAGTDACGSTSPA